MGEVRKIDPVVHFKTYEPFDTGDQFNKQRGTWFYRGPGQLVHGPFAGKITAAIHCVESYAHLHFPMRKPFETAGMWWWRMETPGGEQIAGPYENEDQAAAAINQHIQQLKDKAGHDRYR